MFIQSFTSASKSSKGFTLIELLIVVAIIAILVAIAVPNFLEAQTRAKVSRVQADLRTLATGIEAYRVDNGRYPDGTDSPNNYDEKIADFLGTRAKGFCTIKTRTGTTSTAGRDFFTLTTPIAYVAEFYKDPFVKDASGFLTFCYFPAKKQMSGWVLSSFGPDADLFEDAGGKVGAGTLNKNPLSTASDAKVPARLGDINEEGVIQFVEGTNATLVSGVQAMGGLRRTLDDLSYDPTNGTVSDGDIYRVGP